jgi:hypothetical protein
MTKIDKKIVGWSVVKDEINHEVTILHQERLSVLSGKTYKIAKSPLSESALYVTLNDHDGKPFEIFLNSKDTRHHQWIVALTRVISSVFRKGGDCTFLIEELKSIHDPGGGYFKKGKYIPSLVAEIGHVLEEHFIDLGLHEKDESLAVAAQAMMKEKIEKKEGVESKMQTCQKCGQKSAILMDGCWTCTAEGCYYSKCG